MGLGVFNIGIYLGSGPKGRARRLRLERQAREHGYIKKGKVLLNAYIVDKLEDSLPADKQKAEPSLH